MIPDVFIVGAPRCGTSSLHRYLDAHPQVYMSSPKEPHFFGSDLEMRSRPCATQEEYLALFDVAGEVRHAGEASVLYLYSHAAPGEILKLSPDARVVIMLRDPVDFIASLHAQNVFAAYEDIPDVGRAIEAEGDRREGRRIPPTCIPPITLQYTALARYAEHVARYREAFGPDRVQCILLEDLKAQPGRIFDGLRTFLALEGAWQPDLNVHNKRRRWRHPAAGRALVAAYTRAGLLGARLGWKPARFAVLGAAWALFGAPMKLNMTSAPPEPLSVELQRDLRARLREDVGRLGELLGRDLSSWSSRDA